MGETLYTLVAVAIVASMLLPLNSAAPLADRWGRGAVQRGQRTVNGGTGVAAGERSRAGRAWFVPWAVGAAAVASVFIVAARLSAFACASAAPSQLTPTTLPIGNTCCFT